MIRVVRDHSFYSPLTTIYPLIVTNNQIYWQTRTKTPKKSVKYI